MKNISIVFIAAITLGLTIQSCSTVKRFESKSLSAEGRVIQVPTIAELKVDKQAVSAEIKKPSKKLLVDEVKSNVIAEALRKVNADVLIDPRFEIERKGKRIRSIKVTGYPATYESFRKFEDKDTTLIKVDKFITTEVTTKRHKKH